MGELNKWIHATGVITLLLVFFVLSLACWWLGIETVLYLWEKITTFFK